MCCAVTTTKSTPTLVPPTSQSTPATVMHEEEPRSRPTARRLKHAQALQLEGPDLPPGPHLGSRKSPWCSRLGVTKFSLLLTTWHTGDSQLSGRQGGDRCQVRAGQVRAGRLSPAPLQFPNSQFQHCTTLSQEDA